MGVRRAGCSAVVAAGVALALAGCAPASTAQPTVQACGLNIVLDHFSLTASSASSPHPALAVCLDGSCSAAVADAPHGHGVVPRSSRGAPLAFVSRTGVDEWSVAIGPDTARPPSRITFVVGPSGAPLATRTVALSWHRGDPSDQCHHWQTVDPVRITAP